MSTTWKELQETCLRKIFSLDGAELVSDSGTTAYLNAMPSAANEAMMLLATIGRYWRKVCTIEQGTEGAAVPSLQLGSMNAYDLKEITGDFYCMDGVKLATAKGYGDFKGYEMEGDNLLLLPADLTGTFRIWYNAYPQKLTVTTPGETVIELHPEALTMVAHYMAGQIYKDDDISIAQLYMNEFMTWLEELKNAAQKAVARNGASGGGWKSVNGWY